jgi:hypothetical protein
MGFFSYNCGVCSKPVLNMFAAGRAWAWTNEVAVLLAGGSRIVGNYDGYGGIDGASEFNLADLKQDSFRIAHRQCADSKTFDDLKPAENDDGQGHFYDVKTLLRIFGQPAGKAVASGRL